MPEYGGIVSSKVQRLEDVGPTPVRISRTFLAERHNIKPGSVLAYSAAPIFVTEGGQLRLRRLTSRTCRRSPVHRPRLVSRERDADRLAHRR